MFKAIFSAVVGGNPMSWAVLALGTILALGGAFGGGYYVGSTQSTKIMAQTVVSAVPKAAAAQAAKDDKDYQQGLADGQKLGAQKQASTDAADRLKAKADAEMPKPTKACPAQVLAPDLVHGLNDPAIIGDGK